MLDLAFHKGLLSGTHYAMALLRPLSTAKKPRNPYWCPMRWLCFRLGFSLGAYQTLYKR